MFNQNIAAMLHRIEPDDFPIKSRLDLEKSTLEDPIVIKTDDDGRYVDIEHASIVPSEDLELKFRNHYRVKECIITVGNMRLYFQDEVNGTAQTEEEIMKFCNDYFNL